MVRNYLFEEELARANTPPVALTLAVGPRMVGPILCQYGTEDQKKRFLPEIRSADIWWCQGYSETEAGSDLANLRTKATRVEGGWRVEGSKCWTSYAHWADLMACLVRTDSGGAPQQGLTLMAIDMRDPGVTVRPLKGANGRHFFNEVRIDNVFVGDDHVIGPLHKGWGLAKTLLEHERLNAARVAENKNRLDQAVKLMQALGLENKYQHEVVALTQRLVSLQADHAALEAMVISHVAQAAQGHSVGASASILKLRGTELLQEVMSLITDIYAAAPASTAPESLGLLSREAHSAQAFYVRGFTLAAGTSEIQRNVIARHVLHL